MKRRFVTTLWAALAACTCAAAWPLVIVRYTGAVNGDRPQFERLMAVHGEFPGSCDEIWLSAGGIKTVEGVAADCAALAHFYSLANHVIDFFANEWVVNQFWFNHQSTYIRTEILTKRRIVI